MTRRSFRFILVVIWCALIFYVTASPRYTFESTYGAVSQALGDQLSHDATHELNLALRKSIHLLGFGVLALLSWWAMEGTSHAYVLSLTFSALYAASDEWHQSFVPGRTAALTDVVLDTLGAALFLFILHLYRRSRRQVS